MHTQIQEFRSFIAQATTSIGRGLSSLTCDRADRSAQMHAIKAYAVELTNKCTQQEATEVNTNPEVFVPNQWCEAQAIEKEEQYRRDICQ